MSYETRGTLRLAFALTTVMAIAACSEESGESGESAEAGHDESPAVMASPAESADRESGEGAEHSESPQRGESAEQGEQAEGGESREGGEHSEGGEGGEHGGEGHDEGGEGEEGEEGGELISKEATWDATRRGARLVLTYDAGTDSFVGTVENTTNAPLCAVRVEVHLAAGSELGPTARTDLAGGQSRSVTLAVEGESFESWTAHPEVSACS